ncbi:MAG TPA: DUF3099 domain-containing protein [Actinopolymorphaceae bacterium]|jgi:hypothetical protein
MRWKPRKAVYRVTTAPRSLKQDIRGREIRYLLSMGVRTVCFIGAFVTQGMVRWLLVVAAFVLPYIAVVIANAGRERHEESIPLFVPDQPRQLPAGEEYEPQLASHRPANSKTRSENSRGAV